MIPSIIGCRSGIRLLSSSCTMQKVRALSIMITKLHHQQIQVQRCDNATLQKFLPTTQLLQQRSFIPILSSKQQPHQFSTAAVQQSQHKQEDLSITTTTTNSSEVRSNTTVSTATAPSASSAATTPIKNKKGTPRRSIIDEKDPITVTDAALRRIHELLTNVNTKNSSTNNSNTVVGIRLGTKRRGCNGLSYTLNYATQEQIESGTLNKDKRMIVPYNNNDIGNNTNTNIHIYIEPMALFNIIGTVMDWTETEMSSEFTFQNPNSKGSCGCGESFNV